MLIESLEYIVEKIKKEYNIQKEHKLTGDKTVFLFKGENVYVILEPIKLYTTEDNNVVVISNNKDILYFDSNHFVIIDSDIVNQDYSSELKIIESLINNYIKIYQISICMFGYESVAQETAMKYINEMLPQVLKH